MQRAVRAFGAFALTGHGIGAPVTAALLNACRRFFALPQAERDAIDMLHSPYFRGYSAAGIVVAVGAGVSGLELGDRLAARLSERRS